MKRPTPRTRLHLLLALTLVGVGLWRLFPGEHTWTAEFANASGITVGDDVRVAGIDVGKVKEVRLDHGVVRIGFTLDDDVPLSRQSRAEVKLATILGQHYLDLVPGHGAALEQGATIPLARTTSAYTIDKFQVGANDAVQGLDPQALSGAVDALTRNLDGDPEANRAALRGIAAVSGTIASREEELRRLIHSTRTVTDVVHDQQGSLMRLLGDADKVSTMLNQRRTTIELLLRSTRSMVHEVNLLVRANQTRLRPTLLRLHALLDTLVEHRSELDESLRTVSAQSRYFANATGNGPWIEVFAPDFLVTDNIVCALTSPTDCR